MKLVRIFNDIRNILVLKLKVELTSIYNYTLHYNVCMYERNIIKLAAEHILHLGKITKENSKAEEGCQQSFWFSTDYIFRTVLASRQNWAESTEDSHVPPALTKVQPPHYQ